MENKTDGKILFQYIMNYKAYRRGMLMTRITLTVIAAGGLCGLCAVNIPIGITVALIALFVGAILIIAAYNKERSYTIYDDRVVIKCKDRRADIGLDGIEAVSIGRAFYEKDLLTSTITVTARTAKGGKRKYRLKHIFDCGDGFEFLKKVAADNKAKQNQSK